MDMLQISLQKRETEVIKYSLFKHLLGLSPTNTFLFDYFIYRITSAIMRVQNQKLAISQFPIIVQPNNTISIFTTSIHYWATNSLQMRSKLLAMAQYILSIRCVQNFTIYADDFLNNPRYFSRTNPLSRSFQLLLPTNINSIYQFLNLRNTQHRPCCITSSQLEPRQYSLKTAISTAPSLIIELLIRIMVVFVGAFCKVLQIFVFRSCFQKYMWVSNFLRNQTPVCNQLLASFIFCLQSTLQISQTSQQPTFLFISIQQLKNLVFSTNCFADWLDGKVMGLEFINFDDGLNFNTQKRKILRSVSPVFFIIQRQKSFSLVFDFLIQLIHVIFLKIQNTFLQFRVFYSRMAVVLKSNHFKRYNLCFQKYLRHLQFDDYLLEYFLVNGGYTRNTNFIRLHQSLQYLLLNRNQNYFISILLCPFDNILHKFILIQKCIFQLITCFCQLCQNILILIQRQQFDKCEVISKSSYLFGMVDQAMNLSILVHQNGLQSTKQQLMQNINKSGAKIELKKGKKQQQKKQNAKQQTQKVKESPDKAQKNETKENKKQRKQKQKKQKQNQTQNAKENKKSDKPQIKQPKDEEAKDSTKKKKQKQEKKSKKQKEKQKEKQKQKESDKSVVEQIAKSQENKMGLVVSKKENQKKSSEKQLQTLKNLSNSIKGQKLTIQQLIDRYKKEAEQLLFNKNAHNAEKQKQIQIKLQKLQKEKNQRHQKLSQLTKRKQQLQKTKQQKQKIIKELKDQKRHQKKFQKIQKRMQSLSLNAEERKKHHQQFLQYASERKKVKPRFKRYEEQFEEFLELQDEDYKEKVQQIKKIYRPLNLQQLANFEQNYLSQKNETNIYRQNKKNLQLQLIKEENEKLKKLWRGQGYKYMKEQIEAQKQNKNKEKARRQLIKEYSHNIEENLKLIRENQMAALDAEQHLSNDDQLAKKTLVYHQKYIKGKNLGIYAVEKKPQITIQQRIALGNNYLQKSKHMARSKTKSAVVNSTSVTLEPISPIFKIQRKSNPYYGVDSGKRQRLDNFEDIQHGIHKVNAKTKDKVLVQKIIKHGQYTNILQIQRRKNQLSNIMAKQVAQKLDLLNKL